MKSFFKKKTIQGAGSKGGGPQGGGDTFLRPPPDGTVLFQSISFAKSLELICEGPIEGPVRADGSRAEGLNILESVHYDNVPVKEQSSSIQKTGFLGNSNIQLVGQFNSNDFELAIDNITGNLDSFIDEGGMLSKDVSLAQSYINEVELKKQNVLVSIQDSENITSQFGFVQYNVSGIFSLGDGISGEAGKMYTFETRIGGEEQERILENEGGSYIQVPKSFSAIVAQNDTGSEYFAAEGRVEDTRPVIDFHGGGIFFFYIGDNPRTRSGGAFNTGKFLVDYNDANLVDAINSGVENNYDVLIKSGNNSLSFGHVAQTQKSPARGATIGERIALSFVSESQEKFNFSNTSVEFRLGQENQDILTNHSKGERDIEIQQSLFGPFSTSPNGSAIEGDGNSDIRLGGNFAGWQNNNPQDYDEYSYTHVIQQNEVEEFVPTVSINQLKDTQSEGEDGVGRDLPEFVTFVVEYGFEGDRFPKAPIDYTNMADIDTDLAVFRVDLGANTLSGFVSGSGPIILRKTGDLGTGAANVGTDLTVFGFTAANRGQLYSNIKSLSIINSGSGYVDITGDLNPQVIGHPIINQPDIASGLSIGAGGGIQAVGNFAGGAFAGPFQIDSTLTVPEIDISVDVPNVDKRESSIGESLSAGVPIEAIALQQFQEREEFKFEGIVASPYMTDLGINGTLPKNKELKGLTIDDIDGMTTDLKNEYDLNGDQILFPGKTWRNVNRYARVRKKEHETESILINRDVSLVKITEIINSNFKYPFCALAAQTIDARSFNQIPARSYDLRLKKVLVPSNYNPQNANGSDKRFIEDESSYGLRNIQTFNGSTYVKVADKIDLGTENYEISLKIKLPDMTPSSTVYLFEAASTYQLYLRVNSSGQITFGANSTTSTVAGLSGFSNQILTISCKRVGAKITLSVTKPDGTISSSESTGTSRSYNLQANGLFLGGETDTTNRVQNASQIADFKIKKNNQLLHHWDGTIIDTTRLGRCFRDRFGGNHGEIIGTVNAIEDSNFEFGRNKKQIYVGEWDGSFKTAWTDNPAWILYDLMINPVYGIGTRIDDLEDIDIFNLYLIGRYCDAVDSEGYFDGLLDDSGGLEPRFSCNILLKEAKNAFEVIGFIASIFRGMTYWQGGSFHFSIDQPKEVMGIFNNSNVFDGVFEYGDLVSSSRFTRVEVPYADKSDDFKIKKEYIEDEERIRRYGLITNQQNGIGCTSKSQARRLGKYILLSNKLETEVVGFQAGPEVLMLSPGDIIRIDDELKNFEINYGKVLEIETGANPYILVDDSINTGSILLGDSGGLFLQTIPNQEKMKSLFDISKFEQQYFEGDDQDSYSGVLDVDKIERMGQNQVNKFYVTGFQADGNFSKLLIDNTQDDYDFITGVKVGSQFNVQLDNQVENLFKVIKVAQKEVNIFEVQASQYESGKFEEIEEGDLDLTVNNYNIGIVENEINRPTAPASFTSGLFENNLGGFDFSGLIQGQVGGDELKYRVGLTFPNGRYQFKEFLKDDSLSTPFEFLNLDTAGQYNVVITSLRNPESSEKIEGSFFLEPRERLRNNIIFDGVSFVSSENSSTQIHEQQVELSGIQTTESLQIKYDLKGYFDEIIPFGSSNDPSIDIDLLDESGQLVKNLESNYKSDSYEYKSESKDNRDYKVRLKLKDRNGVVNHKALISVFNPRPSIESVKYIPGIDSVKFELGLDPRTKYDLDYVEVYKSESETGEFGKIYTEKFSLIRSHQTLNLNKNLFYNIGTYDTGVNYYKFLPFDDFGSGNFSDVASGQLYCDTVEAEIQNIITDYRNTIKSVYFGKGSGDLKIAHSSNGMSKLRIDSQDEYGLEVKYVNEFDVHAICKQTGEFLLELYCGNDLINRLESSLQKTGSFYLNNKSIYCPASGGNLKLTLSTGLSQNFDVSDFNTEFKKINKYI